MHRSLFIQSGEKRGPQERVDDGERLWVSLNYFLYSDCFTTVMAEEEEEEDIDGIEFRELVHKPVMRTKDS
jgi:hypothetical protein